jgi:hypothetical protein
MAARRGWRWCGTTAMLEVISWISELLGPSCWEPFAVAEEGERPTLGAPTIFKSTAVNGSVHENSNGNGITAVKYVNSHISESKVRGSHTATSINMSPDGKIRSQIDHILVEYRIYLMFDHTGQQIVTLTTIWRPIAEIYLLAFNF